MSADPESAAGRMSTAPTDIDSSTPEKRPISSENSGTINEDTDTTDPDALHRHQTHKTDHGADADGLGRMHTAASSFMASRLSLPHEIVFVFVVCCAQLVTQAGLGQSISIIHIIGNNYGLDKPEDLPWFMAAYSMTVGTFILISGRLGDLYGHKRMLVIGYLWYAVWSAIAGLAVYSNVIMFDICRALQGIGPSILLPNGLAILGSSYPDGPRKHMVFAIFGAMAPSGAVLGACFASLFALTWWPWAFWVFAIVLCLLALLAVAAVPAPPIRHSEPTTFRTKVKQIDLLGASVGITSLLLINVAWNQAPIVTWHEPHTYILLLIGILLIPLFFYIELRIAPFPLLPLEALKSTDIAFVLGCIACGWGCFGIWFYYLWQFHLELRGASPLLATAQVSPVAVSGAIAAIATGFLLGRIGPAWTMVAAMSAFLAGITILATMPIDQTYWSQAFICVVVIPWGMDMSFPASTVILSNAVSKRHQGVAASLVNTVVNYSISIALGIAGTADLYVNKGGRSKEEVLAGYRAALYVGVGLAGCGWLLSLAYLWHDYQRNKAGGGKK
ncbi:major facilitator superfamily-domain-containing protein [Podospora appendiculata]|uniref:Major facilitator superfamily-domain-containing protein n=1 Tax=Podospora appendiculata TaxID=314037 RepID=A0AAE1C7Z0_9PEZI|nr:major facilitator superfamily-domain-containing protein [Podospora appendiculata]